MTDTPTVPALVGLGPGPTTGVALLLARPRQVIGRAAGCDIQLIEAHVDPQHAVLITREGRTWVQDLGSPGGTFVNGQRLGGGAHPLRRGDVVVFGTVALRLGAEARPVPPAEPDPFAAPVDTAPVGIGRVDQLQWRQRAGQQDAQLREIAALRVRAGRWVGCGAAAFVLGFGVFLTAALGLVTDVGQDRFSQPLGRDLLGVPCGLLGWSVSAFGMVLLVGGVVLHMVAAERHRRIDRDLPWPPSGGVRR